MSETFTAAAQALKDDAELRARVLSAGSAEERAAILAGAGLALPTHGDLNSAMSSMNDVTGAGNASTGTAAASAGAVECAAACI